jgi:hypothetical protein
LGTTGIVQQEDVNKKTDLDDEDDEMTYYCIWTNTGTSSSDGTGILNDTGVQVYSAAASQGPRNALPAHWGLHERAC